MYTNIFDAHCHYDDEWFDNDRAELIEKLPSRGVCGVVTNATDLKNVNLVLELSEKFSYVYGTVGIHPECLENLPDDYLDRVAEISKNEKIVAIGEIGLDYHWDIPKDAQMKVVKEQLTLANDLDMPVVFHDREAHGDTMELLRKYKPKGLLHCYSGSTEMLKEVIKLGMYISLGGVVTFKNARVPVEVAKEVPLDRLLLETDAPYLAPVPYRGKRNDSSLIPYVAEKIAEIRGISPQELINITTENAKRMYGIK
ncbi:MAG: TatD family hydrolase [Ruminococcus sp.]